ncbi:hypothetical protein [Nitrincola iocasae]|nr:hypothetical protein [Nitrincola iocasae]
MQIILLGAGQTGSMLAEQLSEIPPYLLGHKQNLKQAKQLLQPGIGDF